MAKIYRRNMTQTATYWPVAANDGYGGQDFSAITPVHIKCRWEAKNQLFRSAQGREEVSDAIVYVDTDLVVGGHLLLGDQALSLGLDPDAVGGKEIRGKNVSPTVDGREELHKIFL